MSDETKVQKLPTARKLLYKKGDYVICILQLNCDVYENTEEVSLSFIDQRWGVDEDETSVLLSSGEIMPLSDEVKKAYGSRKMLEVAKKWGIGE